MLSGLTHILSKISYWLENLMRWINKPRTERKQCHGFCPSCPYYELCVADEMGVVEADKDGSYTRDDFDWYVDLPWN